MIKKFDGKKLLVLGSNVGSDDIINYAKENGAFIIVADYLSTEESFAKKIADETLLISTADVDKLVSYVKKYNVDGVFAGISEFNILKAMEVSEKSGLPFYCNRKQWDDIGQKSLFRKNCKKYNVPVPETYFIGENLDNDIIASLNYPVIIKPVDSSASRGVHICYDEVELKKYEKDAISYSDSGVIIEEYVVGDEFTAHYTIVNGKAQLSCIDNRYPVALHEGSVTTIPVARVFPSLFIDEYIQQVDKYMINLCEGMNLKNAVIFIQGIYNKKDGRFAIFEAGLRNAAEATYRFISKINGINSMNFLVDYILGGGGTDYVKEEPYLSGLSCGVISFITKGGKVGSIIGLEDAVDALSSVVSYENRYPVGSDTPDGDTLNQLMIRFTMICENREKMKRDIEYLNANIHVYDIDGNEMVVKFNPDRLFDTK